MKLKSHNEIPIGGLITKAGSSKEFKTGNWRSFRPIIDEKKCINCMFCVVYCPEACIKVKADKRDKINMDYCKGCGICSKECPVKCIKMEEESKFTD